MVLYDVYVVFVGHNNNTIIYAQHRIWIGLVTRLTDTRSAENGRIGADTDPVSDHASLEYILQRYFTHKNF